jgi:hypothetical protein
VNGENSESQRGKLTFVSVGSKFKKQLEELMEKLRCPFWREKVSVVIYGQNF